MYRANRGVVRNLEKLVTVTVESTLLKKCFGSEPGQHFKIVLYLAQLFCNKD